jgi:hypothetical protein
MTKAIVCRWDGGVFRPLRQFAKQAQEQYVDGENYWVETNDDRSMESHRHYFACLKTAFDNIPERYGKRWRDHEALRRWALIHSGWCITKTMLCKSDDEAHRRAADEMRYNRDAEIVIDHWTVTVRAAVSQARTAMGKRKFEQSKQDVFAVVSKIIGTDVTELEKYKGAA